VVDGDDFNFATGSTIDLIVGWIVLFGTLAANAISRGGGGKKEKVRGIKRCQAKVINSSQAK
jgi:hypothetical protein